MQSAEELAVSGELEERAGRSAPSSVQTEGGGCETHGEAVGARGAPRVFCFVHLIRLVLENNHNRYTQENINASKRQRGGQ